MTVTTTRGRFHADVLVLAAGAWLGSILGDPYARWFVVSRQVAALVRRGRRREPLPARAVARLHLGQRTDLVLRPPGARRRHRRRQGRASRAPPRRDRSPTSQRGERGGDRRACTTTVVAPPAGLARRCLQGGHVHVHHHPRWRLRHRSPPGARRGAGRLRVLRPRVQALRGHRRGGRRGDRRRDSRSSTSAPSRWPRLGPRSGTQSRRLTARARMLRCTARPQVMSWKPPPCERRAPTDGHATRSTPPGEVPAGSSRSRAALRLAERVHRAGRHAAAQLRLPLVRQGDGWRGRPHHQAQRHLLSTATRPTGRREGRRATRRRRVSRTVTQRGVAPSRRSSAAAARRRPRAERRAGAESRRVGSELRRLGRRGREGRIAPLIRTEGPPSHSQRERRAKRGVIAREWLGRMDSNHRMPDPKSGALPLGDSPARASMVALGRARRSPRREGERNAVMRHLSR